MGFRPLLGNELQVSLTGRKFEEAVVALKTLRVFQHIVLVVIGTAIGLLRIHIDLATHNGGHVVAPKLPCLEVTLQFRVLITAPLRPSI